MSEYLLSLLCFTSSHSLHNVVSEKVGFIFFLFLFGRDVPEMALYDNNS